MRLDGRGSTFGLGLGLMVLTAALTAVPEAARAEEYGPDLETYRRLIDRYRAGEAAGPVAEAGSWGPIWIESTVERLLRWCRDDPEEDTSAHIRAAQGAFLLHLHAALADQALGLRSRDQEAHRDAALDLLRWVRDRYDRDPRSWPREARGLRPRDFYLALGSADLLLGHPEEALAVARESLWGESRDAEMRLLAGCALEAQAVVRRQVAGRWPRRTLRSAEESFREALDDDPALLSARLRLGWVLVRRDREGDALPHLEAVAEAATDRGRRALAWLFLSAAHDRRGDLPARIAASRRAVELVPHLQAAQVAFARALEEAGGDVAARAVVGPFFTERSRSWVLEDPWSEYAFGSPELRLRPLEKLRRRLRTP